MNARLRRFVDLIRTPPRSARAAYDAVAAEYDHYERAWRRVAGAQAVQRVASILAERLPEGALVLDAGAGTGATSGRVLTLERSAGVVGLDLSRSMLRVAQRQLSGRAFCPVQADMMLLPFAAERFDAVVSTWALETLPDPRAAAQEMLRVLQPDGFIVCAFSSAATDRLGALEERLLRRPLGEFAGRFLTDQERPMHWCSRSSLERFDHGLTTVVALGKCCTLEEFGPCLPPARSESGITLRKEHRRMAKDPVCGMDVEPASAAATSEYRGETIYFCAPGCKRAFDKEPERYLGTQQEKAQAD
jgi:ubiquinone/menaquinone biosynthesis C-methylase UbiE/YHS domain-containing protein